MYSANAGNPASFGGNGNLRPLNRLKDPYADSLLFGNDNNTTSVANTSTSFQVNSSLGLSPIKNNQPSSKKPLTPSFDRSFETNDMHSSHHFPSNSHNNPLAGGSNCGNGRRTVLEVNMKGRKQPPLSSSLFADYSGLDFKPTTAPSSSTNHNPAITPNHRMSSYAGVTPQGVTSLPETSTDSHHNPTDTNPLRSLHPHLSLSKISPAMDRLETLWSSWIIVYGYDPRVIQLHDILYHFQQYGEIIKQYSSQQNWILLKYDSPVEADRATIQPCFFLPNHQTLLAVHRMNSQLATSLQLHVTSDDTILSSTDSIPSSTNKSRSAANKSLEELAPFLSPDVTSSSTGLRKRGREHGEGSGSGEVADSIDADIYIKPKRQKSVCERVVDYFFSS